MVAVVGAATAVVVARAVVATAAVVVAMVGVAATTTVAATATTTVAAATAVTVAAGKAVEARLARFDKTIGQAARARDGNECNGMCQPRLHHISLCTLKLFEATKEKWS